MNSPLRSSFRQHPERLFWLLLPFIAFDSYSVIIQAWNALFIPWHTCPTESAIIAGAQSWLETGVLYPPLGGLPFLINIYSPLAYVLPAMLAKLFGATDPHSITVAGRLVSFFFSLGIVTLVGAYARWRSGKNLIGLLGAGLILYFHSSTLTELIRIRPESPGIFFSLLGWMLFQYRAANWPILSAISFALAFAFKQPYIIAAIACGAQLLIQRRWWDLDRFASAYFVAMVASCAFYQFALGDAWFTHTIRSIAMNPAENTAAFDTFSNILVFHHWRVLAPAAGFAILFLLARGKEMGVLLYGALAFLWALYSQRKIGADLNYHAELSVLLVLLLALGIGEMVRAKRAWLWSALITVLLLGGFGHMSLKHGPRWNSVCWYRIYSDPNCKIDKPFFGDWSAYVERYRAEPGRKLILHDEIASRVGQAQYIDPFLIEVLIPAGIFREESLLGEIDRRGFDKIIFHFQVQNRLIVLMRERAKVAGYQMVLDDGKVQEWALPAGVTR